VLLVEQVLLSFPGDLSSSPVYIRVRCARYLDFCVVICLVLFVCLFNLAIVMSDIRYIASDYPYGIVKLSTLEYYQGNRVLLVSEKEFLYIYYIRF
jgi:hypothetical protein